VDVSLVRSFDVIRKAHGRWLDVSQSVSLHLKTANSASRVYESSLVVVMAQAWRRPDCFVAETCKIRIAAILLM